MGLSFYIAFGRMPRINRVQFFVRWRKYGALVRIVLFWMAVSVTAYDLDLFIGSAIRKIDDLEKKLKEAKTDAC